MFRNPDFRDRLALPLAVFGTYSVFPKDKSCNRMPMRKHWEKSMFSPGGANMIGGNTEASNRSATNIAAQAAYAAERFSSFVSAANADHRPALQPVAPGKLAQAAQII